MAGLRTLVSVLLVCISYHAITAAHTLAPRDKEDKSGKFSYQCGNSIATVSQMPNIQTCMDFRQLFPIHAAQKNISIPIQSWLAGMCAAKDCPDEGLKAALAELSNGCAAELKNNSPHAGALFSLFTYYKDIKSDYCKNTKKLDFCQPGLVGTVDKLQETKRPFLTVSAQAYCNECNKKSKAETPNPPTKRSEPKKKGSLKVCRGSDLDEKRIQISMPALKEKSEAPAKPEESD
ncbi:uncharacterized protein PGTG_17940 [Puccinia graminis f. sp. tritici CRL 75-36-700-3]|uniref:Uncharacterized protein n=1 Tax=Puccinia graminis f. sp. tritici (strain CRL 75-36-700-3 / race SCCL) TaxID=418459 RepID=E3L5T8_PUCGT|nr:uncharacterized protein PGTG_17940 [Puccinia graminis f. sp. tritici CRL 75-36-700-3]EFP91913.1 hypothetical protein PGTG_17940 [Puccinia graminis f. sp. tritici CRL 75-36-700-3]